MENTGSTYNENREPEHPPKPKQRGLGWLAAAVVVILFAMIAFHLYRVADLRE
jgi:hypothetical protein